MKKPFVIVGVLVLIISGLIAFRLIFTNKEIEFPQDRSSSYMNATYIINGKQVTLKEGVAVQEISGQNAKLTTNYFGNEVKADFNGDGRGDIAFLLIQEGEGSGTFFYVVAALAINGGVQGTNAILLGDRIAPQTTEYRDGKIIVNYADRKFNEPMTAQPSVGVTRYLKVFKGQLLDITAPTDSADKFLNLSNQGLKKVPDYVFKRTDLERLDVSYNELTGAIQAEIRNLQNLRVLDLSNNQMTGVPAEIGQLQKLETLDLSNNMLTGLPYELGNLKNLKVLNISGNNYSLADLEIITKKLPSDTVIIK